ncbi:hypothetical protein Btru_063320 [Bulinus truncatus]|nr:hypothetical protein Btru_063320 [Bulinus truncatus]
MARNSIFGDITALCFSSQIIQVTAPPSKAPNIFIPCDRQSSQKSFIEDRIYIMTCSVGDGVPLVSNITVSCGNITGAIQTGNVFTAAIKFSRNMTGQNCTCTAQHISGCYVNNTSHIPIQVDFISTVTNFRSQNSATFIKNGTWTEMVCEADGFPSPKLSILKGNAIVKQILSGHFISYSKVISCKDSGIYVCQTDNEIYAENLLANQSQVTVVWVLCIQKSNTFSENDVNIAAAVGGSLATFTMIIVIAVGVFIKRKYTITIRKKKHIQNKTIHNYSDLTVSQQPQDRHNYETPNINPEARTANRKTNYVNVLDGAKEDHPYDQITNEV